MKITKALQSTAYHEAGHAVVAWREGIRVNSISIVPEKDSQGHTSHANPLRGLNLEWDDSDKVRFRMERAIMVCLAGPLSQHKYCPKGFRKYHAQADWEAATDLLTYMAPGLEYFSAYWNLLEVRTKAILEMEHIWQAVTFLATALLDKPMMKSKEIRAIILDGVQPH